MNSIEALNKMIELICKGEAGTYDELMKCKTIVENSLKAFEAAKKFVEKELLMYIDTSNQKWYCSYESYMEKENHLDISQEEFVLLINSLTY